MASDPTHTSDQYRAATQRVVGWLDANTNLAHEAGCAAPLYPDLANPCLCRLSDAAREVIEIANATE